MVKIASHDDGQRLEDIVSGESSSLPGLSVIMNNAQSTKWNLSLVMVTIIAGLFSMSSCSGGGGGGAVPVTASESLWVTIDTYFPNYPDYSVQAPSVDLGGEASCDNCPSTQGGCGALVYLESDINIAWKNLTSGETGTTDHGIVSECYCDFSYCWTSYHHGWIASAIPLNVGPNTIKVTASDAFGGSGNTSIIITRLLDAPDGLMATAGAGQITLSWNRVRDATSYNLYWSTSSNFTKDTATKIENVTSPYTHSGLSNDVTYYYFMTAVTGSNESSVSSSVFATAGWHTEDLVLLPTEVLFANPSIAIGPSGNMHIFYIRYGETNPYNDILCYGYYLTNTAGYWLTDSTGYASWDEVNIAVDQTDTAHISFNSYNGIVHGIYSLTVAVNEDVDSNGYRPSLALDSTNKPHIAYCSQYYDYNNNDYVDEVRYTVNSLGTWTTSIVYEFPLGMHRCGDILSFALDKNGSAHIVYSDIFVYPSLQYATNQEGHWTISTIDTDYSTNGNVSIAVDANGKVHMVFKGGDKKLKYAHNIFGTWTIAVIDETTTYHPSLAVDAAGKVHISYESESPSTLKYATNASGVWNISLIDTIPSPGYSRNRIALDPEGKVHIVYYYGTGSSSDHILKYAKNK